MTNLQLLLAIGIPSLLVIFSWIQQGTRLSRLEASFDKRSEAIERKFDGIDSKFDGIDKKFDAIRTEMVALRDSIHRDMISLHERIAVVESKQA